MYWVELTDFPYPIIRAQFPSTVHPHGGAWAAWLGGVYGTATDDAVTAIAQRVTVSSSKPFLSYWHWIASADICGYDVAGVGVDYGAPDPDVVDAFYLCSAANTSGWRHRTIDMHKYIGQTVILIFLAGTDSSFNSNWFLDDVSFQVRATTTDELPAPNDPAIAQPHDDRKSAPASRPSPALANLVRRIQEAAHR